MSKWSNPTPPASSKYQQEISVKLYYRLTGTKGYLQNTSNHSYRIYENILNTWNILYNRSYKTKNTLDFSISIYQKNTYIYRMKYYPTVKIWNPIFFLSLWPHKWNWRPNAERQRAHGLSPMWKFRKVAFTGIKSSIGFLRAEKQRRVWGCRALT